MAWCRRVQHKQQWRVAVLALWLHGLLAAYTAQGSPCPQQATVPSFCQPVPKVCVDQNVFVLYGIQHNPRHELFSQLPDIRPGNISVDYFGYGGLWGTSFPHPPQLVRPATGGEETQELRHPQFSRCTSPMVLYVDHLYKLGHFFASTVAVIHMMQESRLLDNRWAVLFHFFVFCSNAASMQSDALAKQHMAMMGVTATSQRHSVSRCRHTSTCCIAILTPAIQHF